MNAALALASTALVSAIWIVVVRPEPVSILYTVPIFVPFFALGWDVLLARRWRRDLGVFVVWFLGGVLLAARFAGIVLVSGHVAWCVLMAAHVRLRRPPLWVGIALAVVAVETLVFKILWKSWLDTSLGLLAGGFLAVLLTKLSPRSTRA